MIAEWYILQLMAGVETGKQIDRVVSEAALLERHRIEINADVLAIHRRFDAEVAKRIGFKGSIFEAFRGSVREDKDQKYYVDTRAIPDELQPFVVPPKKDKQGQVTEQAKFKYESYDTGDESVVYLIEKHSAFDTDDELTLERGSTYVNFFREADQTKLVKIQTGDLFNKASFDFTTRRSVEFVEEASPFDVMRIGQGRRSADINPLVYGDLDQEGVVWLHLDQGIYDLKGGYTQTKLKEDSRQLEVKAGGELFYFPLRVHPKDELADAAKRLGV